MGYNYSKLRGKIREKFDTQEDFAKAIGKSNSTISKKLNNMSDWTREEMVRACEVLDIPLEDASLYFFCLLSCEITTKPAGITDEP